MLDPLPEPEVWPPPPPELPPTPPAAAGAGGPHSRRFGLAAYAVAAVLLFGVVGGGALVLTGGGHAGSPATASRAGPSSTAPSRPADIKSALVASIQQTDSVSMHADISMQESFSVTGPGGAMYTSLEGYEIGMTIHVDQESAQRAELQETVSAPGVNERIIAVLYDGTCYVSRDGGATYQTVSAGVANSHQVSPKTPLQFLNMVGNVTRVGDATLNDEAVTQYHADLDPVKVDAYFKSSLAAQHNALVDRVLNHIGVTDGSLDTWLDGSDNIVGDDGQLDAALDLGAFDRSEAGTTMHIGVSFRGSFTGYHSPVSVARPGDVTGSTNLA
jgi:hypothetical protein